MDHSLICNFWQLEKANEVVFWVPFLSIAGSPCGAKIIFCERHASLYLLQDCNNTKITISELIMGSFESTGRLVN